MDLTMLIVLTLMSLWTPAKCTPTWIQPVDSGLLVLGGKPLKIMNAVWTVIVAIEKPKIPLSLIDEVYKMKVKVAHPAIKPNNVIGNVTLELWKERMTQLEERMRRTGHSSHREKRAILGFMNPIFHALFGTITADDLKQYEVAIDNLRMEQREIVHEQNNMISVMHSLEDQFKQNNQRVKISILKLWNMSKLIEEELEKTNHALYEYAYIQYMNSQLEHVDLWLDKFVLEQELYQRRYASLELGRLTEELLPTSLLQQILQHASSSHPNVNPLDVHWYYQNSVINPLWMKDKLYYRVLLPLTDAKDYKHYQIYSMWMPFNQTKLASKLEVPSDVGIGGKTAFLPHSCIGQEPQVCRTGARLKNRLAQCIIGIISEQSDYRAKCVIKMRNLTELIPEEIHRGEYLLSTLEVSAMIGCDKARLQAVKLVTGTYVIMPPAGCKLTTDEWELEGLLRQTVNKTIWTQKVNVQPINWVELIPTEMSKHIDIMELWEGEEIVLGRPSPRELPPTFHWSHGANDVWMYIGLCIIAILIIICIVSCILYKMDLVKCAWIKKDVARGKHIPLEICTKDDKLSSVGEEDEIAKLFSA